MRDVRTLLTSLGETCPLRPAHLHTHHPYAYACHLSLASGKNKSITTFIKNQSLLSMGGLFRGMPLTIVTKGSQPYVRIRIDSSHYRV